MRADIIAKAVAPGIDGIERWFASPAMSGDASSAERRTMNKNYKRIVDTLPHMKRVTAASDPTLAKAIDHINKMDLSKIQERLCSGSKFYRKWNTTKSEIAIQYYKNFLFINMKYLHTYPVIPPSFEIDEVWHQHILDTLRYTHDCANIFGRYFHHYPHFGTRGPHDAKNLEIAFEVTQFLHTREFGSPIISLWEEST